MFLRQNKNLRKMINTGGLVQTKDSLHLALKPIIIFAQFFAVFPVDGIASPDTSQLKYLYLFLNNY